MSCAVMRARHILGYSWKGNHQSVKNTIHWFSMKYQRHRVEVIGTLETTMYKFRASPTSIQQIQSLLSESKRRLYKENFDIFNGNVSTEAEDYISQLKVLPYVFAIILEKLSAKHPFRFIFSSNISFIIHTSFNKIVIIKRS